MTRKEAYRDMLERCSLCAKETRPSDEVCEKCYFPVAIDALQRETEKRKQCEECEHSIPVEVETGLWEFEYGDECYGCKWCLELDDRFKYRKVDEDRGKDY